MKNHSIRAAARPAVLGLVALVVTVAVVIPEGVAQQGPVQGVRKVDPRWEALVGATVVSEPGRTIDNATVVIRDGVIVSVEPGLKPPDGARVWDYSGLTIYPGLIEPHLPVATPEPDKSAPGDHWNPKVTPQRSALSGGGATESQRTELRKLGFTAAAIAPKDGVFRGSSAVVLLDDPVDNDSTASEPTVVRDGAYQELSFETGGFRLRTYPSSQMGAIALIRQTLLDADWRAQALTVQRRDPSVREPLAPADALDALGPDGPGGGLFLFDSKDELEAVRAATIAKEFGRDAAILGSGTEFRRLDAIVKLNLPIVAPMTFPKQPDVSTIADANAVSLRELMTWEQAPTNARRLRDAGVFLALTTDKLRKGEKFMDNLRSAIRHGLSEDAALEMLTTNPAHLLGVEDRIGRIAPGFLANVVVADGDLFKKKTKIRDVWIAGRRNVINPPPDLDLVGTWTAAFVEGDQTHTAELTVKKGNKITFDFPDHQNVKARKVQTDENRVSFLLDGEDFGESGVFAVTGVVEGDRLLGTGMTPAGAIFRWRADRDSAGAAAGDDADKDADQDENGDDEDEALDDDVPEKLPTPFGAFGFDQTPPQEDAIITGATIWTAGADGVIKNGTLVISGGKIVEVSDRTYDNVMGLRIIDAAGKHITPGIIDAHSHTAISGGVNEGTHAVTSEVRIGDVINPDSIALWRELAGGVTTINQLHGSANPIGGQNSVIKLRWGVAAPDEMRFDGAPAGIKFALGENVKQSNWGDKFRTRYPQTRMGVETIIRDRFDMAREYGRAWDRYNNLPSSEKRLTIPPRRDLQLEALGEVLDGDRLVHSHSYRQDEILMLCRVAQDFGFKIGTFQHVLEGYKVAEAIKENAIGASTFSDWWAYKFEVYDAIPYNGAIMDRVGVSVSFNSDSGEQARRLNTEAGKAVKYGGLDPAEAIKFVTYNPAVQLGIADRVGSLAAGKDADFVIWSGDPLSYFSKAEATFVDGREMFSIEKEKTLRQHAQAERQRIIQKILAKKSKEKSGDKADDAEANTDAPAAEASASSTARPKDRAGTVERERMLEMMRSGRDPDADRLAEITQGGRR